MWLSAIQIPKNTIQITLKSVLKHPPGWGDGTTLKLKGNKAKSPIFMDCKPKGMPMMVIISSNPATKYSSAITRPPKSSQMMLPNKLNFICLS
jgi:hypothetical protein